MKRVTLNPEPETTVSIANTQPKKVYVAYHPHKPSKDHVYVLILTKDGWVFRQWDNMQYAHSGFHSNIQEAIRHVFTVRDYTVTEFDSFLESAVWISHFTGI